MMHKDIQIIIFDKDGTLFDCIGAYAKEFGQFVAKPHGISLAEAEKYFLDTAGLPTEVQVTELYKKYHVAHQDARAVAYAYQDYLRRTVQAPLFPDVRPALEQLKESGKKIMVSSSNSEVGVKADLEREKIIKDVNFYAGISPQNPDYVKGEPHFRAGAKHLGYSYEWFIQHAVMIGDSEEDMRIGSKCGLVCIGRVGVFTAAQLKAAGADLTVENFSQLTEFILSL